MRSRLSLTFRAPGPIAGRFMLSRARVKAIMGPIGSGKTSSVLVNQVQMAGLQRPSPIDAVRRYKFCVVRDTYRQLWETTIPSWWKWMPKTTGSWSGGSGEPARHAIKYQLRDRSYVELIAEFIAIGEHKVEDVLRGYEPTSFYLNEADLLAPEVLIFCRSRAGRYPNMQHGGPSWYGVMMDFNAPDIENYVYKVFVEEQPDGHEFFRQPGGLSPQAENIQNLPPNYYDELMKGQPDWWVRRYVHNEWGYSRDGKPVYPEFSDALHVASSPIEPVPEIPLIIGADAGLTPAAVIKQRMPDGQWRTLDEIVAEPGAGMGPMRFGELLAQRLKERFEGFAAQVYGDRTSLNMIRGYADPAAAFGVDKNAGERDWIQIVSAASGVRFRAAPTNKLIPRLEAVRTTFTRMIDGTKPGYLLSPRCTVLRKAYNSGYRYKRVLVAGPEQYRDEPDKNQWSHAADADQYAHVGGGEYLEVMGRQAAAAHGRRQTTAIDEDTPQGEWRGGSRQAFAVE